MDNAVSNWPQLGSTIQDLPVAYLELDAQGTIRVVNAAACLFHRLSAEELIDHSIWEFLPGDEVDRSRADFLAAFASYCDPPVIRRSLLNATGEYVTHQMHRRVLRDIDGQPIGMSYISVDIGKVDEEFEQARRDKSWLESVIDAVPQAIVVVDALGFVRLLNPSAERLIGWSAEELVGQQFEKGVPILSAISRSGQPLSFLMTLKDNWNGDVQLLHRDGKPLSVWLSVSPTIDKETGSTNGVVMVLPSPDSRPAREPVQVLNHQPR